MATAPKKTPGLAKASPPPADLPVDGEAAAIVQTAASTPVDGKAGLVIPVSVSIDTLLEALRDNDDIAAITALRVVGPRQGRRRVGRAFGPEAVTIPLVNLGEDELRAIDGDPALTWSIVQAAPDQDDEE